jgi:glutamate mutase epsilon subunit
MELHAPIDRTVTVLQKTNRVSISRKGHALFKRNTTTNSLTGIHVGKQVQLLNDYDAATPFEAYDVDLSFYKHEIDKIIHAIDPPCKQMPFAFPD